MRQSHLFSKTRREAPADETAKNGKLLVRAGFVRKALAGAYEYLPLGLRVLENARKIIREEMVAAGGQEVSLTALQDPELWKQTNRWDDAVVDNWFKTKLASGGELGLGLSHEEPLVVLMKEHISSHRDLPCSVFQFQTKFRNELRAKSGLLRGREFPMKDCYSFARSEAEHRELYERFAAAYVKIFNRAGIGAKTVRAVAAGGIFCDGFSDEFLTECEAGEDTVLVSADGKFAINEGVATEENLAELKVSRDDLSPKRCVEVGNIFSLGTKYSVPLGLSFNDEAGERQPVIMGCYGIGVSRLLGTVVEALGTDSAMVWPKELAPYRVHIVQLGVEETVAAAASDLYDDLA
ncbi:MAG TPA: aminoacyl--tRNA ligase-related protein, partial [archaeon]|nr:aminoacyl--tRNA ligase-related protein [archaeon]